MIGGYGGRKFAELTKLFQLSHYHDSKDDPLAFEMVTDLLKNFQAKSLILSKQIFSISHHFIHMHVTILLIVFKRNWNLPWSMIWYS